MLFREDDTVSLLRRDSSWKIMNSGKGAAFISFSVSSFAMIPILRLYVFA